MTWQWEGPSMIRLEKQYLVADNWGELEETSYGSRRIYRNGNVAGKVTGFNPKTATAKIFLVGLVPKPRQGEIEMQVLLKKRRSRFEMALKNGKN